MTTKEISRESSVLETTIFANIDSQIKALLIQDSSVIRLNKKGHLLHCGDPLCHYYYVIDGSLQLYRPTLEGEEKVFYSVKSGDIFFESEVFLPDPVATFSVLASEPCSILQLSSKRLIQSVEKSPTLAKNLLQQLGTYYYRAINRIDTLTISNASQRLVLYLFELSDLYQTTQFDLPSTQKCLAKQLNIAPETLSRIIHKLCETHYLTYHNGHFQIIDADKLKKLVDLPPHTCSCQAAYPSF